VPRQILHQFAVAKAPNFDVLVPTTRDDDRVRVARREFDAAGPDGVVTLGHDELAFSEGVPEADGPVARRRDDLSVIRREGDAENIFGVSNERARRAAGLEIPESQSSIPGGRKSEKTVRRDDDILNEMRVPNQRFLGIAVVEVFVSQIPNEKGFIPRRRNEQIRVFGSGGKGSDPPVVSLQDATKNQMTLSRRHPSSFV